MAVAVRCCAILLGVALGCGPAAAQMRGNGGPVRSVAISSDGSFAVSGSFDTSAIRWSLPQNAAEQVLRFHDGAVNAALFAAAILGIKRPEVREELRAPRLERAIGVVYRPETELQSHYFQAVLPVQFDEYVWFDETQAVRALPTPVREGMADTYPFGV